MAEQYKLTLPLSPCRASQPMVRLDIGGNFFRVSSASIINYPESLLAKTLSEFHYLVEEEKTLFIDRSPKLFEWILEVHRDGDYRSCVPDVSLEVLEKELAFYQLPSAKDLGLDVGLLSFAAKASSTAKQLLGEILEEIKESGLEQMFPWDVYIYHKITDDRLNSTRRVFVRSSDLDAKLAYVAERSHGEFLAALEVPCSESQRNVTPVGIRMMISPNGTNAKFSLQLATNELVCLLKQEAERLGLVVSSQNFEYEGRDGRNYGAPPLRVNYGHE